MVAIKTVLFLLAGCFFWAGVVTAIVSAPVILLYCLGWCLCVALYFLVHVRDVKGY